MFHGREHPALVRSLDVGRHQIADLLGIFSERSRVDDGIGGIRVHVGIRKEIPVHADGSRFLRRNASEVLRVFELAVGAEGHGVRKVRAPHQPRRNPALKIRRKQQRQLRVLLQPVQQFGRLVRLAAQQERAIHVHRHGKRTHVILLHVLAQLQVLRTLHVEKAGAAPDHEDLANFLFDRQLAQRLLRPLVAVRRVDGRPDAAVSWRTQAGKRPD